MKKTFCALLSGLLLLGMLSGCSSADTPDDGTAGSTTAASSGEAAQVDFSKTDKDMFTDRDLEVGYDESECITITLSGSSATASDSSVKINGSTVTITKDATYLVSGTLEDGMLIIDADDTAKMQVIFDGVNITSATSAALYILEADKVFLTLADGSQNSLSNGGEFVAIDDNNIDAALFSKQDLTMNGEGSLTVTSPAGHGIVCKDDLVLTSGTYAVSSSSHGIDANDSVRLANASVTISAGKDGIHAENSDEAELGFVYISSGNITIEAEGDGISGGSYLQVEGGNFDILAGGGYENGSQSSSGNYGSFGGGFGGGMGGGMRPRSAAYTTTGTSTDATSMKGLKSGSSMLLSNGSFTIDSADDSLHANESLTINGGTYQLASGDDGVHAETELVITSCTMDISECYEGLEAEAIAVAGGDITINASDDGLNASGGADSSGVTGGRDGMFGGGMGGGMMSGTNANANISICGGKLTIHAGGDGLDSNGNLTISGGYTVVYNPKSGDTSVLDSQYSPVITGGTYIGLGITTNMAETFSATSSTQGVIACSVGNVAAGSKITIADTSGNVLISCTAEYSTALLIISNPDIVKGQTYTVTAGTVSGDLQAS